MIMRSLNLRATTAAGWDYPGCAQESKRTRTTTPSPRESHLILGTDLTGLRSLR